MTPFETFTIDAVKVGDFARIANAIDALVAGDATCQAAVGACREHLATRATPDDLALRIERRIGYGAPATAANTARFNCLVLAIRTWERTIMVDVTASQLNKTTVTTVGGLLEETALDYDPGESDHANFRVYNRLATATTPELSAGAHRATPAQIYWALHVGVLASHLAAIADTLARSHTFAAYMKTYPFTFLGRWDEQDGGRGEERARWIVRTIAKAPALESAASAKTRVAKRVPPKTTRATWFVVTAKRGGRTALDKLAASLRAEFGELRLEIENKNLVAHLPDDVMPWKTARAAVKRAITLARAAGITQGTALAALGEFAEHDGDREAPPYDEAEAEL